MSTHNLYQASQNTFVPQRAASEDPKSSKTYHATAEWGKRGMTLQELTRAFDAFNEAEERVAIGFACSEDCNRKLAEPLSEVKTIFLDLDGLKPRSGCSSVPPTSSAAFSPRQVVSHVSQSNPDISARDPDELGYLLHADDVSRHGNASRAHEEPQLELDDGVDEDTIRPSQKRRRRISSLGTPSPSTSELEEEPDAAVPTRPPSRLGFIGDEDTIYHMNIERD
ncbi:hypothetical protein JB92DRAFT_3141601 [Gautieria morchelliformis]|nr:hypothetical protein JB92DRAFT_3141601 [Gautieria morchelliformis]